MQRTAIVRGVPRSIGQGEITHIDRKPIDPDLAEDEHSEYVRALSELGCRIVHLPPLDDLPDSVFVEDTAVVVDEMAILTRPGASSRRPEVDSIAPTLGEYRPLVRMTAPGTLDGGDVLRVGKRIWIGRSSRTNDDGIQQLRALLEPLRYTIEVVTLQGCLHLKSAVTAVRTGGRPLLLMNPEWVDASRFADLDLLPVDTVEPMAANALEVDGTVLFPAAYPATRRRLLDAGIEIRTVPAAELAKAEGALTCCSVIV